MTLNVVDFKKATADEILIDKLEEYIKYIKESPNTYENFILITHHTDGRFEINASELMKISEMIGYLEIAKYSLFNSTEEEID